jgi:hypothetical protein
MIPLNGFCYRTMLQSLDLLGEFENRFGTAQLSASCLAIHTDPRAARWIWEQTSPLKGLTERLGPPF